MRRKRGVEERGLDAKDNLTRLPRIPALSDTINTFSLFVLLPVERKPQRSDFGQKDIILNSLPSYDLEARRSQIFDL